MDFFVGTYSVSGSPGIAACGLQDGQLVQKYAFDSLKDPNWLTLSNDRKTLYAHGTNAGGERVVRSYTVKGTKPTLLSEQSTGGNSTCHLTLDSKEQWLIACHYHEGRISLFPVTDGKIGERLQVIQQEGRGPVAKRQESAHAHQSVFRPGTLEVYVCDLGADRIFVYSLKEKLERVDEIVAPAGSGPRHLVFDGADRLYVCGELSSEAVFYSFEQGGWKLKQRVSTLPHPVPDNTCAAIRLFGRKLYVSNRGHDSIARFDLATDGSMKPTGHVPAYGKGPRDAVRIAEGFLAANQFGGGLTYVSTKGELLGSLEIPGAVCIAGTE